MMMMTMTRTRKITRFKHVVDPDIGYEIDFDLEEGVQEVLMRDYIYRNKYLFAIPQLQKELESIFPTYFMNFKDFIWINMELPAEYRRQIPLSKLESAKVNKKLKALPEEKQARVRYIVSTIYNKLKKDAAERLYGLVDDTVYNMKRGLSRRKNTERAYPEAVAVMNSLNGVYPIEGTPFHFRISNHPLDVLAKSESQIWGIASCEKIQGGYDSGIYSDIEYYNAVCFVEDNDTGFARARIMLRWAFEGKTPGGKPQVRVGVEKIWYCDPSMEGNRDKMKVSLNSSYDQAIVLERQRLTAFEAYTELYGILANRNLNPIDYAVTPYSYRGYSDVHGGGGQIEYTIYREPLRQIGMKKDPVSFLLFTKNQPEIYTAIVNNKIGKTVLTDDDRMNLLDNLTDVKLRLGLLFKAWLDLDERISIMRNLPEDSSTIITFMLNANVNHAAMDDISPISNIYGVIASFLTIGSGNFTTEDDLGLDTYNPSELEYILTTRKDARNINQNLMLNYLFIARAVILRFAWLEQSGPVSAGEIDLCSVALQTVSAAAMSFNIIPARGFGIKLNIDFPDDELYKDLYAIMKPDPIPPRIITGAMLILAKVYSTQKFTDLVAREYAVLFMKSEQFLYNLISAKKWNNKANVCDVCGFIGTEKSHPRLFVITNKSSGDSVTVRLCRRCAHEAFITYCKEVKMYKRTALPVYNYYPQRNYAPDMICNDSVSIAADLVGQVAKYLAGKDGVLLRERFAPIPESRLADPYSIGNFNVQWIKEKF